MKRNAKAAPLPFMARVSNLDDVCRSGGPLTIEIDDPELLSALTARVGGGDHSDLMLCLLPRAETGAPIYSAYRKRLEDDLRDKPASRRAAVLCRNPQFWQYLHCLDFTASQSDIGEQAARQYICRMCEIDSRRTLDQKETAGRRYRLLIETPFLTWLNNAAE